MFHLFDTIFLIELINTSTSLCRLLLACVERMAFGTDFHMDALVGGACYECVPTVASHGCLMVLRMDSFLHLVHLFYDIFAAAKPIIFDVHIRTAYGTTNSDIIVA